MLARGGRFQILEGGKGAGEVELVIVEGGDATPR